MCYMFDMLFVFTSKAKDDNKPTIEGMKNSVDMAVLGFVFHCVLIGVFSCFSNVNDYILILLSYILMLILVVFM
jgi:hypothetical protein